MDVISAVREADDDLLVFLHGLGCSMDSFQHFWNQSGFTDYSALAMDLIGFGESSKSDRFSYTMQDQARVCAEILARYFDKRLHLVTHSMGCAIGLLLPDEVLKSIKTFVSIEGNLIGADCGIVSRRVISVPFDRFEFEVFPELQVQLGRMGEGYYAMDSTSAYAMYKSAESLVQWSDSNKLLDKFLSLSCRKAYFYGDENSNHPTVNDVVDVPQIAVKKSGHFSMTDNPIDFYTELHRFIFQEGL